MESITILDMHALVTDFEVYLRQERMRSPRTTTRYIKTMRDFVAFLGEHHQERPFQLEKVTRANLVAFLTAVSSREGGAPSKDAWNLNLSVLRTFYASLFEAERIDANPAKRLRMQKVFRDKRTPLSFEEMLRLVDAVEELSPRGLRARNTAIVKVFLHSGLRVAELASLRLDRVDAERRVFVGVQRKGDKLLSVEFNDVVAEAIENYEPEREKLARGQDVPELFLSKRGTGMSVRTVQEVISVAAGRAGITRPVSPHVLRHSNASLLAKEGKASLETIREMLGHESIATTQIYVHPGMELRRQASTALGARWKKAARDWKRQKKDGSKVS